MTGHDEITAALVRRLLRAQFPHWAQLPIEKVEPGGWDNRTFRLGDQLSVRLPSADGYVPAVAKEQHWLPRLAPQLPVAIPEPVGIGEPSEEFPRPWSVYRWLPGEPATTAPIPDATALARELGEFLVALRQADPTGGPTPGLHCWWRGAPLDHYDDDTQRSLRALDGVIDTDAAREVWAAAKASRWDSAPVWFHGDIAHGNLLLREGRLSAVIDFGTSGVGDPACDLVIAWNFFDGPARAAFRAAVGLDEATWARGRGWALWKAMLIVSGAAGAVDPEREASVARGVIDAVIAEHRAER